MEDPINPCESHIGTVRKRAERLPPHWVHPHSLHFLASLPLDINLKASNSGMSGEMQLHLIILLKISISERKFSDFPTIVRKLIVFLLQF
jgi:hypothetical protein